MAGDPSAEPPESPVIGPVTDATRDAAFAFHRADLGEFIPPPAPATCHELVDGRQVFTVGRDGTIAGLCYVRLDRRLGFIVTDQTIRLGPDDASGYPRRDGAGFATARVLRLPEAALARIADDLEHLDDGSSRRTALSNRASHSARWRPG